MGRVKEAMLSLMEDEEAAPTARATAARALALIEKDMPAEGVDHSRSIDTMSVAELDADDCSGVAAQGRQRREMSLQRSHILHSCQPCARIMTCVDR